MKTTEIIMNHLKKKDAIFDKMFQLFGYIEYQNNMTFFQSVVSLL